MKDQDESKIDTSPPLKPNYPEEPNELEDRPEDGKVSTNQLNQPEIYSLHEKEETPIIEVENYHKEKENDNSNSKDNMGPSSQLDSWADSSSIDEVENNEVESRCENNRGNPDLQNELEIIDPLEKTPAPIFDSINCHCLMEDNEKMIQCSDCKKWTHYSCTALPVYMLKQLSVKNRKYQCQGCTCIVAADLTEFNTTCDIIPNSTNKTCTVETTAKT